MSVIVLMAVAAVRRAEGVLTEGVCRGGLDRSGLGVTATDHFLFLQRVIRERAFRGNRETTSLKTC